MPTSLAVHGPWARLAEDRWYAPGSVLHHHIRTTCTPSLYPEVDYFRWSGDYTEHARRDAGRELATWVRAKGLSGVDTVFAHSHGGNVVLDAVQEGVRVRLLVLLHTPVTPRGNRHWSAIRKRVDRVLVMRSRADVVMLADGLRTGSTLDPNATLLPHRRAIPHWVDRRGWFNHGLFLDYRSWSRWDIAGEVAYERATV